MRVRVAVVGLLCITACGMQTRPAREPILPELEEPPPVVTYNSRVVALRTSLGRAAITLDLRSIATDTIRSRACDEPVHERLQTGCARCELAGEGDAIDSAVLDTITADFALYPTEVLEATHIEHVALCKKLGYEDIPETRDGRVAGTVDLRGRRLFVSIAPFLDQEYDREGPLTTDDIVHHELFHLFEFERMRAAFDDDVEWRLYNPLGFEYRAESVDEPRQPGFINPYASTTELEDRASMFQYLLARPAELCAIARDDALLRAKTRLLWKRVSALVGAAFLRERATCVVPWLDSDEQQQQD